MKIKRFENILNEAGIPKNILSGWEKRVHKISKEFTDAGYIIKDEMILYLKKLLPNDEDNIDFTESGYMDNAEDVYYDNSEIIRIKNIDQQIYIESAKDDVIQFKFLDVRDAIQLLHLTEYLYKYQKTFIKENPGRIKEIIPYLHPSIKKEYPHLLTGTDLNLL